MAAENPLTRKVGPLPLWGWLIAVAGGLYLYARHASTGKAQPTGGFDPNAVDPSTGLTYGQEQSLQLGYGNQAGSLTPTTGATTDGQVAAAPPGWQDVIGGLTQVGGAWRDLATAQIQGPTNTVTVPGPPGKAPPPHGWQKPGQAYTANLLPAPFGPKKPPGISGFSIVGLGSGYWAYKPNKPAAKKPAPKPKPKAASDVRAPANPRENVHAQAASHMGPAPARTRVTVRHA